MERHPRWSLAWWLLASHLTVGVSAALALLVPDPARPGSLLAARLLMLVGFAVLVALTAAHYGSRSLRGLARAAGAIACGAGTPAELRRVQGSRVSEVCAVACAVERMGDRLRERMDGAQAFAGNAAHELRTPIATLRGTLELMLDDAHMEAAQRERFLGNGIAELDRLDALVGGLLALGRVGRMPVDEVVDLDALLRRTAEAHGIAVQGHASSVRGSAAALHMVITNLVDNAVQHGGDDIRVIASCEGDGPSFDVVDDGPGIDPDVLTRVFDRFFTTDRRHGVGLGLPVVQSVVRAHGGDVQLTSRAGCTRVSVRLRWGMCRPGLPERFFAERFELGDPVRRRELEVLAQQGTVGVEDRGGLERPSRTRAPLGRPRSPCKSSDSPAVRRIRNPRRTVDVRSFYASP